MEICRIEGPTPDICGKFRELRLKSNDRRKTNHFNEHFIQIRSNLFTIRDANRIVFVHPYPAKCQNTLEIYDVNKYPTHFYLAKCPIFYFFLIRKSFSSNLNATFTKCKFIVENWFFLALRFSFIFFSRLPAVLYMYACVLLNDNQRKQKLERTRFIMIIYIKGVIV